MLTLDQAAGELLLDFERDLEPRLAALAAATWPSWSAGRPSSPGPPAAPPPSCTWPSTFATWLEDAGIPARVIDELMGHEASGRGQQRGGAMGAHYRHTTPEMAARVVEAVQQRLAVVLQVAEGSLENNPNRSALRVL